MLSDAFELLLYFNNKQYSTGGGCFRMIFNIPWVPLNMDLFENMLNGGFHHYWRMNASEKSDSAVS